LTIKFIAISLIEFIVFVHLLDWFKQTLLFPPLTLDFKIFLKERQQDFVILFEIAASSRHVLLIGHAYKVFYRALQHAGVAETEAVFKAQDLFFVLVPVQYLLSNGPSEAYDVSKSSNFRIPQFHLTIQNKVDVGPRWLILFVHALVWLHFE